ncbi:hypothetical protein KSX_51150 [Ktedonospora formicarum]|uniref:Uncharacterized protein n=1 Tax=Ktedonospora formicarum TaxID=2778364 RepID=A0A8J3HZ86_9CHLR|nr:hypothetical protein KSX_51150 [Ktedonospora formicarum]
MATDASPEVCVKLSPWEKPGRPRKAYVCIQTILVLRIDPEKKDIAAPLPCIWRRGRL